MSSIFSLRGSGRPRFLILDMSDEEKEAEDTAKNTFSKMTGKASDTAKQAESSAKNTAGKAMGKSEDTAEEAEDKM